MKKKREFEPNPETPLEHWNENIDPAIMSGDHWVEEEEAPLIDEEENRSRVPLETHAKNKMLPGEHFMHPTHQVGEKKWHEDENEDSTE
ncbi:DUF3905 domain-containing protein [Evansella sp. AB-P1]|uniref:DUF3905 domain-containing protein n=1 Tax=Evansella sp. AB-P1 TaxID=3037653 RepID=UPI00241FC426|nr:DUF3905 domain-containing protein [Evansella sp. AB-P1]MDG5788205.1 DUF3905 domain-containing protein [Evansella sp. AB-P1]